MSQDNEREMVDTAIDYLDELIISNLHRTDVQRVLKWVIGRLNRSVESEPLGTFAEPLGTLSDAANRVSAWLGWLEEQNALGAASLQADDLRRLVDHARSVESAPSDALIEELTATAEWLRHIGDPEDSDRVMRAITALRAGADND